MVTSRLRRALLLVALLVAPTAAQRPEAPPPVPAASGASPSDQTPTGAAPAAAQDPQVPVFRTGIDFVRVDVIVSDRQGQPVTDLTPGDFEVFEDNRRQSVETFRLVKIDEIRAPVASGPIRTREDEERAAQQEDARVLVFFLDDYHVRLGSSLAARQELVRFVQTLGPKDLLAVMYPLSPLDAVVLTRDHAAIIRMLERFQGRKFDYTPRNEIESKYQFQPTEVIERIRRQVSLSAIEGLAVKLGSLREGRKSLILVSEGYTAVLPPQMRDAVAGMPGAGNPNRGNPMAGENDPVEDRARFLGQLDLQEELRLVFDAANRSNTAIYAVDPRGLSTGEFDIQDNVGTRLSQASLQQTMDTLRILATETDGRAIVNRNDLARGMAQIVRDSSAYYLLGYTSTQGAKDGRFHEIRVRVKRPGVQVRARRGYWAVTAEDARRAEAPRRAEPPPAVARSLSALASPVRGRTIRTWLGMTPGPDGRTRMRLVWEPAVVASSGTGAGTAGSPTAASMPVRVEVRVGASQSGTLHFRGRVPEAVPPSATAGSGAAAPGSQAGRGGTVDVDLPPGTVSLRLAIEDVRGAVIDTEEREVDVPDFSVPRLVLATPAVHLARTPRDARALLAGESAVPTALRDFRRTDRVVLRLGARSPGGVPAVFTARLLNRAGIAMRDLDVTAPVTEGAAPAIDVPMATLPVGEYLVEVRASLEGSEPVLDLVAFRVVP